jgi:hypothetical protein
MLNEIENGLVERITQRLESARKIGVQKGVEGLTQPAVYASAEAGTFKKVGQSSFEHEVKIFLDVIFSNLKDQRSRREGINLILEGIVQLLTLQTLDLSIDPLRPLSWRNTTTEDMDKLGLISYSLELRTAYIITRVDDEAVTDLLTIGLQYYLKPGDDTADAGDTVTLSQ